MLPFALGVLLGLPWALAFAPFQWWWLGVFAVCVLPRVLPFFPRSSRRSDFSIGFGFGLAAFCVGVHWLYISLHDYGGLNAPLAVVSVFLVAAYLALFAGLSTLLYGLLARSGPSVFHPVVWAGLWTFSEWLRGTLFTGFAWLSLGDALVDSPFAFLLPHLGNYGALFALMWAAGSMLDCLCGLAGRLFPRVPVSFASRASGLGALLSTSVLAALWAVPLDQRVAPVWVFTGVQTNVDQSIKFDPDMIVHNMERVFDLGDQGLATLPAQGTLIFPETVTPLIWTDQPQAWLERFRGYAAGRDGDVIMGAALQEGRDYTNSIVQLQGEEEGADLDLPPHRHAKRHLVPFGEFIPTGFHWFVRLLNMPMGEFARGQGPIQPFLAQSNAIVSTVCYEDTFSGEFAGLLQGSATEATVLLNLSNLAWFGQSWALEQHAQMGRTRSAEHRKPTVRVTNTGLSGVVDARGQWLLKVPPGTRQTWAAQVQGRVGLTPFAKTGQLIWFGLWFLALVAFLVRFRAVRAYNSALFAPH